MDKKKFCFRQGEFYFVGRRDGDCNHRVHPYVRFREFGNGIQSGRIQRTSH